MNWKTIVISIMELIAVSGIIGAKKLDLKIKELALSGEKRLDTYGPEVIAAIPKMDTTSISDDPHGHVPGNITVNKSSLVVSISTPGRKQELSLSPYIHNPENKTKPNGYHVSSNISNIIPLKHDNLVANAIVRGSPAAFNSEPHEDLQALPVNINHGVKHKLNNQESQNPSTRKNKHEHWWHRQRRMWRKRNNYMKRNGKAFEKPAHGFANKNTIGKGVKRKMETNVLPLKPEEEPQEMHREHNRNPPAGGPKHRHLVNSRQNPKKANKRMQPHMYLGEYMPYWRKGEGMLAHRNINVNNRKDAMPK